MMLPMLGEMLAIEDDPSLLGYRCETTGLPLWPQIRVQVFRMMMSDLLYKSPLSGRSTASVPAGRAVATMARSLARNSWVRASKRDKAAICITGDGVADQMVDGRWLNRLTDHFVGRRPDDSIVLADHFEWRWPFPRHHDRVLLHAPWQAANAVRGRLGAQAKHRRQAAELVQLICQRGKARLAWEPDASRRSGLVATLARKAASMPWQFAAYERLLKRVRPQLLLVGAGCYGPASTLIAAAKRLGVSTAEYQHGAVSAGHDAYNFAPAVLADEAYRSTLPDHFLGYGNWWNSQINAPMRKWAIGNPHRAAKLQAVGQTTHDTAPRTDLLVLSDGIEFGLYLDLARQLIAPASAQQLRVVLRPHPLERTRAGQLTPQDTCGVVIDSNADIYASLQAAQVVVSEVSTGLFEAVGLVERIFIWDTPKARFGYPVHPFQAFGSAEEIAGLLADETAGRLSPGLDAEDIWAGDWASRYDAFLAGQVVS